MATGRAGSVRLKIPMPGRLKSGDESPHSKVTARPYGHCAHGLPRTGTEGTKAPRPFREQAAGDIFRRFLTGSREMDIEKVNGR